MNRMHIGFVPMISRLKSRSEFSRNVLTLMTGTTVAQALPIAISPILTRIYTPEDFGAYAIFVSLISIVGSVANGRYELAIMLPEDDDDAMNVAALGVFIALALSIILLLVIVAFKDDLAVALGNAEIAPWLYLVPLSVFLTGFFNVLTYYNTRIKAYKDIASRTIYKSLVLAVVQLAVGALRHGPAGLIGGVIASSFAANARLLRNTIDGKNLRVILSKKRMLELGKKYLHFPLFTMWATLANSASTHLVTLLISTYHSSATLGFYSLSQRLIGMPGTFAGGSISQVYFQNASAERKATGSANKAFNSTVKKLVLLSLPFCIVMFFAVEPLSILVFGQKWAVAGLYAKILLPLTCIKFIFSPVSVTFSTFERQKLALILQLGLMFVSIATITISGYTRMSFISFLHLYTIIMSAYYLLFLLIAKQVSCNRL